MQKQRKRIRGRRHLGVITGGFQLAAAVDDRLGEFGRARGSLFIHWGGQPLKIYIKWIEQD